MLVFVSDLHFVDESAGKHNLTASAFEGFFTSVEGRIEKADKKIEDLKIVFLGDIFDLLRTERWFDVEEKDRPWGDNTPSMKQRACEIFSEIKEKNEKTFKLFDRGALAERFNKVKKVESIYIPGNHDRLCWMIDELRSEVVEVLGLDSGNDENFKHRFESVEHGVYALHGHIYDKYNYEGGSDHTLKDYELVPIGDPITTELISRLPYQLVKNIKASGRMTAEEIESLKRNFQEIDNVRPFSAILKWLLYKVQSHRYIKDIIEDTVDEVIREFNKLKYVKKWYDRHDKWLNPMDSADKIQYVLFFLEKFKVFPTEKLFDMAEKVSGLFANEDLVDGAASLFSRLDSRIQYIVMGHTHAPVQKAIESGVIDGKYYEHVYLNTGTWRKRYHESWNGGSFIGWKDMTYSIIYRPDEKTDNNKLPVFDTWSGALKREE